MLKLDPMFLSDGILKHYTTLDLCLFKAPFWKNIAYLFKYNQSRRASERKSIAKGVLLVIAYYF